LLSDHAWHFHTLLFKVPGTFYVPTKKSQANAPEILNSVSAAQLSANDLWRACGFAPPGYPVVCPFDLMLSDFH
jgi:hypothetical protein